MEYILFNTNSHTLLLMNFVVSSQRTRQSIAYLAWHLMLERGHQKEHWIISHFPLLSTARVNCDFVVI